LRDTYLLVEFVLKPRNEYFFHDFGILFGILLLLHSILEDLNHFGPSLAAEFHYFFTHFIN